MLQASVVHSDPCLFCFVFGFTGSSLLHSGFLQLKQARAILPCSVWAFHHSSFSLQSVGSVVMVHGLCCSSACEIFLEHGWNLCSLHWQANSYPLYHQGSPGPYLSEIRASPVSKGLICFCPSLNFSVALPSLSFLIFQSHIRHCNSVTFVSTDSIIQDVF